MLALLGKTSQLRMETGLQLFKLRAGAGLAVESQQIVPVEAQAVDGRLTG
jgi:hypothetical protein